MLLLKFHLDAILRNSLLSHHYLKFVLNNFFQSLRIHFDNVVEFLILEYGHVLTHIGFMQYKI
jgi:hypothetical protein